MATNDILNKVSAYKSLCQTGNPLSGIKDRLSLNNTAGANIMPFLLDIIVVLSGRDALQGVLQRLIDEYVPAFEEEAKRLLVQTTTNSRIAGVRVASIPCLSAGGIKLPNQSLDFFDKLKDDNRKLSDFQKAVKSASVTGQATKIGDNATIALDPVTREYVVTFDSLDGQQKFGDFMEGLIDKYFNLDINGILDDLLSELFNTRVEKDKGSKDIAIEKLLSQEEPTSVQFTRFDFLEVSKQESRVSEKGVLSGGCGPDPDRLVLSEDDIGLIFEQGADNFASSVGSLISNGLGQDRDSVDKANMSLIQALLAVLLERIIMSSEAVFIIAIGRTAGNGCDYGSEFSGFLNYINQLLPSLKCLIIGLRDSLFDFLVDIIEDELQEVITCLALEYAKERAESYSRIIRTLLPL